MRDLTVSCDIDVTGNVTGGGVFYVGGVAGWNQGTISNCTSLGRVSDSVTGVTKYVGGVVGYNDYGTISNCANSASVSSTGGTAGGVAGYNEGGAISNSANSGGVSDGESAGGVAGDNFYGTISNSANSGGVSGSDYAGGVAGYNFIGTILNCANSGGVSGGRYAGGVGGFNDGSTISNCANIGGVVSSGSDYYAGGVAGHNSPGSSITNSANSGGVSGGYARGGVAGRNDGAITNCGWLNSTANDDVGWNNGGSRSDVVSFASTDNIVTTVLISSRDLTINGAGTLSPVFVCYPDSSALAVSGGCLTVSSYDCAVAALSGDSLTGIAAGKAPLTVSAVITAKKFGSADVSPRSADLSCAVTVTERLDNAVVTIASADLTYSGTAKEPTVTVRVNGNDVDPSGYMVSYANNINAGTAAVTITGRGYCIGTASANFTIQKKNVTIKANPQTVTYGTPISQGTSYVTASGLNSGASLTAITLTQQGTNAGSGSITPSAAAITANGANVTSNYNISYSSGTLTIAAKPVTITPNAGQHKVYGAAEPTLSYRSSESGLRFNGALSRDLGEDVGNYAYNLGTLSAGNNYSLRLASGQQFEITAKAVTITANAQSVSYGTPISQETNCVTASGLNSGASVTAITLSQDITDVGTGAITPSAATITANGANVTSNYNISYIDGTLTITARAVTITANDQSVSYGTSISQGTSYVTASGLNSGANLAAITLSQDRTDVGTGAITPSAAAITANGANVTANYNISYIDGTLTIAAKAVTITANDQTVAYGTPISQGLSNVTASGLNSGASLTAITLTQNRTDAGTGSITPSAAAITASGANVTANYAISYINGTLTITPTPASPDVTEKGRTDGDNSGVLEIEANTTEDFAIYDALKDMTISGDLPAGISDAAKALQATSADVDTSTDIYTKEQIRQAVAGYWDVTDNSEKKIRVVDVKNTIATRTEETLYAKFWRMLVSTFTNNHGVNSLSDDAYLPLQTNFTITSADIAALPDELKNGLSADNLLERVSLFAVVSEDSGVHARSLYDAVSADKNAYITVSGDNDSGYSVHTRVMLFDMPGGVSGDKTTGAKWVKPLKVSNSQGRDNTKDNYFIVQDGASDDSYELCLAFAAKETNYATVNVTISGDITAESVYWTISGDSTIHNGNTSADIRGEAQSVTFHEISGYTVTLSDGTRTLSPDVMTISKDVEWGESWNITAAYARIAVEGVTLDRASAVLAKGDTLALTATVTPGNAYDKAVSWTSGNPEVATVSAGGLVTATGSGSTAITAAAGGQSASCTVTVLKAAVSDDQTITVITPATVVPNLTVAPGDNIVPVQASFVSTPEERQTAARELEESGFTAEELTTDSKGNLVVTNDMIKKAIADIESKSGAISHDHVTALPVVTSSADQQDRIHALGFNVSGDIFGDVRDVRMIKVVKLLPNSRSLFFDVATDSAEFGDKKAALLDADGNIVTGAINRASRYTLTIFILDGGDFDLSKNEPCKVTDPIAVLSAQQTQPSASSGGCAAGLGATALLALLPLALWKRKR
ncbi:MAG: MBG domain-containing protein [Synergistaceae bacterium]|nr:MBG domain-containing protein [Synergistaceae bacterium]